MKFLAFWEQKRRVEKCFWGVFFAGVIVFLFYHFSFESLLADYQNQKARQNLSTPTENPIKKPLPKTKASVLLQEILTQARTLKITQIDSHQGVVNIKGSGEFAPLMRWFYFLESFSQVFILNFKFSYAGGLEFEVVFEMRE